MQVLIENRKFHNIPFVNRSWADTMDSIAGTWIEVDTKYLFPASFNGIVNTELGLINIPWRYVKEIKDDMRPYRKICRWCHNHSPHVAKKCWKCGKEDHFERLTPKKKKLKHSLGEITFTESSKSDTIRGIS